MTYKVVMGKIFQERLVSSAYVINSLLYVFYAVNKAVNRAGAGSHLSPTHMVVSWAVSVQLIYAHAT